MQVQMLLPAFSTIVLQMFFFPESPLYQKRPAGRERWFYSAFLLLTVISILVILGTYPYRCRFFKLDKKRDMVFCYDTNNIDKRVSEERNACLIQQQYGIG